GGHHHDGNRGVDALDGLQEIKAIHAWQFQICNDQVDRFLTEDFQSRFGVRGAARGKPLFGKAQFEQAKHPGFVLDNQYRSHTLSKPWKLENRNWKLVPGKSFFKYLISDF